MSDPDDEADARRATTLGEAERDQLRAELEAARLALLRELAAHEAAHHQLAADADAERPDDEHDPDGTTAYERAQLSGFAAAARARLQAVDETLATLVGGGPAGLCLSCGLPIGLERLRALPGTTRCIACATAVARHRSR